MKPHLLALIAGLGISSGVVALGAAAVPEATKPAASGATTAPAAAAAAQTLSKEQTEYFETKVRPILAGACFKCHSHEEKKSKGGLVLDSREGWAAGGENGPAIVPGDPAKSLLLKAVSYADPDLQMPPSGDKLSEEQIKILTDWVKQGAPDPRLSPAGAAGGKLTGMNDLARQHWAFQPVKEQPVPEVKDEGWVKSPVDAFVLAKLESANMRPSSPAPREALIRRANYDLIGLPPTPAEVEAFVNDRSANAFEKVVDRLLASPHYGERWGRFWLDSARYSDTTGLDNNRGEYRYPFAWTYRDYVIRSFNEDKPYDQFLKEQIVADLLPQSKDDPSRLAALGFITVGKRFQNVNDTIDERIDAVTKSTMALTVSCARCHDHKFDPIPTADYYSLHGIFASTTEPPQKPMLGPEPTGPKYADFKSRLADLEKQNHEIFFDLVETKSADFRKKAEGYLLVLTTGGRRNSSAAALKLRNQLIDEHDLDRDIYQGGLRNLRGDDPVLGVLRLFAALPDDDFAAKADELVTTITASDKPDDADDKKLDAKARRAKAKKAAKNKRRVPPTNPLVVKAFAEVKPGSLKTMRDVTAVYGKLFADIDDRAKAYIKACRNAKSTEVEGYDEALVELFNVSAPIEPASALTADRLREISQRLPVVNGNGYQRLKLAEINELMLTHPGSPARAMVVEDAKKPKYSPIFVRGEAGNRGPIVRASSSRSSPAPTASRSRRAAADSNSPRRSPARTTR